MGLAEAKSLDLDLMWILPTVEPSPVTSWVYVSYMLKLEAKLSRELDTLI